MFKFISFMIKCERMFERNIIFANDFYHFTPGQPLTTSPSNDGLVEDPLITPGVSTLEIYITIPSSFGNIGDQ